MFIRCPGLVQPGGISKPRGTPYNITEARIRQYRAGASSTDQDTLTSFLYGSGQMATAPPTSTGLDKMLSANSSLEDYRMVSNIDTDTIPDNLKKDCVLFYTPDTEPLARKIAQVGTRVELGNIRWK